MRKICRAQDAASVLIEVVLRLLEELDELALIPNVIAGGENFDSKSQQLGCYGRRQAETGGSIFSVGDDQIDRALLDEIGNPFGDKVTARTAEDVTNE